MTNNTTKSLDLKRRLREATTEEERQTILDGLPHDVGFAKPPKSSQFQPGKSGNPKGRSKGSPNLGKLLVAELGELMEVNHNGRRRKLPKGQIVVVQLLHKALTGDVKAITAAMDLCAKQDSSMTSRRPKRRCSTPAIWKPPTTLIGFLQAGPARHRGGAQ